MTPSYKSATTALNNPRLFLLDVESFLGNESLSLERVYA